MNVHQQRIIESLQAGKITHHTGFGNSMLPLIKSGQRQTLLPILSKEKAEEVKAVDYVTPDQLKEGDVVYCKVGGNYYTHEIIAIRSNGDSLEFLIARHDRKRINGWTKQIFGKVTQLDEGKQG